MGLKQDNFTFGKLNQDVAQSKAPKDVMTDAKNIRVITSGEESIGAITNQKGNTLVATLPTTVSDPTNKGLNFSFPLDLKVIGKCNLNDSYVLFATDGTADAVFVMDKDFNITLNFLDSLGFSLDNPIQAVGIYENPNIQKVYWVDGINEVRFLNVAKDNLNLEKKLTSFVPEVALNQPNVTNISTGGSYTSGVVRYAYNQYNLNGAQTKASPLSEINYLSEATKGAPLNDVVSKTFEVSINDIDTSFDYIKVYAIKYDSLNSVPQVRIIYDEELANDNVITLDDGNSFVEEISAEEFIFLGGDIIIPEHIVTKDNYLFFLNYTQPAFDVDYDARAYRFNSNGIALLEDAAGALNINSPNDTVPKTHDCINPSNSANYNDPNYKTYIFQNDGVTLGGEGVNINYSFNYSSVQSNFTSDSLIASDATNLANKTDSFKFRTYKRNEIYRFGIEFIDDKGRKSFTKWIADIRMPDIIEKNTIEDDGTVNYIHINFSVNNLPTGIQKYRIMRVERQEWDKTILTQGPMTATMKEQEDPAFDNMPGYFFRNKRNLPLIPNINAVTHGTTLNNPAYNPEFYDRPIRLENNHRLGVASTNDGDNLNLGYEIDSSEPDDATTEELQYLVDTNLLNLYSPELIKQNINFADGDQLRVLGLVKAGSATSYRNFFLANGNEAERGEEYDTQPNGVLILNVRDGSSDNAKREGRYIGEPGDTNASPWDNRVNAYTRRYGGITHKNPDNIYDIAGVPTNVGPNQGNVIYDAPSDEKVFREDIVVKIGGATGTFKSYHASSALLKLNAGVLLENISAAIPNEDNINEFGVLGEIVRKIPNQYGGNTYESRQRNNYIPCSELTDNNNVVAYAGDTYIQKFNFLRTFKLEDTSIYTAEVLSVPLETSVNLDLRYDVSASRFKNTDADEETYYGFNDVYQQENNFIEGITKPSTFVTQEKFSSRIIASKIKFLGEPIDSFTDISINDILDLDTQYGEITGVINFNDEIFAFQRGAVAFLSINPRAVISSEDGTPTELGSGALLDRFKYVTTKSGTVNRFSILSTDSGIFYVDVLNRTVNFIQQSDTPVSTIYGVYNKIYNFISQKEAELLVDNPFTSTGITAAYDHTTKDIYLTFLTQEDSFTIAYNGIVQGFTSFYDFTPKFYLYNNGDLLSSFDGNRLYEHNTGVRGVFYDVYYPSYVERVINSEPFDEKLFTNLEFSSEVYDTNGNDLPETISKLQLKTDYQDSGLVNANMIRKFRVWRTALPRVAGSRDRIRGTWAKLKLQFDNTEDKKLLLHDIIIKYINP